MTQDEKGHDGSFLSRWSQRKRDAKESVSETPVEEATEIAAEPQPIAGTATEEEFDPSTLPKLEDVVEGTDITGFLKKGVPESVRNAALRKSWALDPAIRNYVNPALDYAYDWNTPGGVPGSGELAAGMDVAKMVLQIMGSGGSAGAVGSSDAPNASHRIDSSALGSRGSEGGAAQNSGADLPAAAVRSSDAMISPTQKSADSVQAEHPDVENVGETKSHDVGASQQAVRRHGTAKPRA